MTFMDLPSWLRCSSSLQIKCAREELWKSTWQVILAPLLLDRWPGPGDEPLAESRGSRAEEWAVPLPARVAAAGDRFGRPT